jgi:septum formation protein
MSPIRSAQRWWSRRKKVVLASTSPRRKELLELTGLKFQVKVPEVNEKVLPEEGPKEHVERLALEKAYSVAKKHTHDIVIGCDTVVVLNGRTILGKPKDKKDARSMLMQLGGKEHTVQSAVAAVWFNRSKQRVVTVETRVRMKQFEVSQFW